MSAGKDGILNAQPIRYLVTAQVMFMLPARNQQEAEAIVTRAINIGIGVAPVMLAMGIVAEPATKQLLEERGLLNAKPDLTL